MPTPQELRTPTSMAADLAQAEELYRRWGCFIATDLIPIELLRELQGEIQGLLRLALSRSAAASGDATPAPRFDEGYLRLCAEDPAWADAVFAACRRLPTSHQLSGHPALLRLSRRLMGSETVMSSPYRPVRIDSPQRQEYLLPWHQDYPYTQDSPDALIYWIPLQDVDESNGCLMVAPGSQRLGVAPVRVALDALGIRTPALADPTLPDGFPHLSLPMRLGEVLVFSAVLLHRSQDNRSGVARWTLQIRHGNFAHPLALDKRWPRGHAERHWFDDTHPELVVPPAADPRP